MAECVQGSSSPLRTQLTSLGLLSGGAAVLSAILMNRTVDVSIPFSALDITLIVACGVACILAAWLTKVIRRTVAASTSYRPILFFALAAFIGGHSLSAIGMLLLKSMQFLSVFRRDELLLGGPIFGLIALVLAVCCLILCWSCISARKHWKKIVNPPREQEVSV